MSERLSKYKNKCNLIKQIQSNKARFYRRINNLQNFITVFVSAFITFMGFSGMDRIKSYIKMLINIDVEIDNIEFVFNILVFLLFFIVISHLVFQFASKQNEAEKAITLLSNLANEIDNIIESSYCYQTADSVDKITDKYTLIMQCIPSNTDREYLKARKSLSKKEYKAKPYDFHNIYMMTVEEQKGYILKLVQKNKTIKKALKLLADNNESLFMGGGIIRNLVWDNLHGYTEMTPIEDIDVIYYNKLSNTKEHDIEVEVKLNEAMPNIVWSVKNQARMHTINNDEPYISIEDAVSKWPETASAILLRIKQDGDYEFIAPFGFNDLFRLIVQPTPHFKTKIDRYKKRVADKKWASKWKNLLLLYME